MAIGAGVVTLSLDSQLMNYREAADCIWTQAAGLRSGSDATLVADLSWHGNADQISLASCATRLGHASGLSMVGAQDVKSAERIADGEAPKMMASTKGEDDERRH